MSKKDTDPRTRAIRKAPACGDVVNRSCCGGGNAEDIDEVEEGPSEDDIRRFGDVTQKCPECGTELYDDAAVCWSCGHAVMRSERGMSPVIIGVVVLLVVALVGFFALR